MRVRSVVLLLVVAAPAFVFAEESTPTDTSSPLEYVVTANRMHTPLNQVASSITVIGSKEIQERGATESYDILRDVPGVDVVRSGGLGGNTAIFMRGANSEHTLVLIDGVEINNPISNARFFNFSGLTVENLDRIEVLRGPQSTLYGSDALGGVINIITKRGSGSAQATASVEGGSYNTFVERGDVSGGSERVNYSFGLTRQDSDGISSADAKFGNKEHDGFHNLGFSGRVGVTPDANSEVSFILRHQDSTTDLDNEGGAGGDDLNRALNNIEQFARVQAALSFFDNTVRPTAGVSYSDEEFTDNNDPDELSSEMLRSRFHGSRVKFDLQNEWRVAPWVTALLGAETAEERGDSSYHSDGMFGPFDSRFSERSARGSGYFAQLQGAFSEVFYPTAGIRVDTNSGFDSQVTWRVGPTVQLREIGTKLFSTVGTGYKAPSLYQRFSDYGDPDLLPEKSLGLDFGVEQKIVGDSLIGGVTYFHNNFDHLITFEPDTFKFRNISEARTDGIESFLEARPFDAWSVRANYTLTDTEDKATGDDLLRRPRHKIGAQVRYAFCDQGSVRLDVLYVGRRADTDFSTFPTAPVTLGGYATVNLSGSYAITKKTELFVRLENLFDREYEEVFGFGTPGISVFGGARFTL